MTNRKKIHNKWHIELKLWFASWMNEPYCERCGATDAICDMAHRKKRYDIGWQSKDKAEYFMALMLCRSCHNFIELGRTHEEMHNLFMGILKDRPARKYWAQV